MGYYDDQVDPMRRVHSVLEQIDSGTSASRHDDVKWCRSWRDTLGRIGIVGLWNADKACRRVIDSKIDEESKSIARRCLHLIRDGYKLSLRVEEIDRDLSDIYPSDKARSRLDDELGLEPREIDSEAVKLDRACMIARANNPNTHLVKVNAFSHVRAKFPTLEIGG